MPQPISAWNPASSLQPSAFSLQPSGITPSSKSNADFQSVFFQALEDVNRLDSQSQGAVAQGLVDGEGLQIDTYVRMMQADLAFRTMLQIRNKLLEAFNEIKQMQV